MRKITLGLIASLVLAAPVTAQKKATMVDLLKQGYTAVVVGTDALLLQKGESAYVCVKAPQGDQVEAFRGGKCDEITY